MKEVCKRCDGSGKINLVISAGNHKRVACDECHGRKSTKKSGVKFVIGFLLDPTLSLVVLLRKNKPAHMENLLLGVGGKIDEGETPTQAMVREFREEAWPNKERLCWHEFCTLTWTSEHHPNGTEMHCFCTTGNVWAARSLTAEKIEVFKVSEVMDRPDTVGNVRWLLQMARSLYFMNDYPGYKVEAVGEFIGAQ